MRDIALVLIMLVLVVQILRYPWIGVLAYAWVSIFNPHAWTFGFAARFPFVMVVACATFLSMVLHPKEVKLHLNGITTLLVLLPLWMSITTLFAFDPVSALDQWVRVMKVYLFVLVAASLLHTRKQIEWTLWVLVLSVGLYGIKGGIFTATSGGGRVYGPPGSSFISDNNAISVAIVMVIPLMYYLSTTLSRKWQKLAMYGTMFLSAVAVLGSHSRGAFLAIAVMSLFLWVKSDRKMLTTIAFVILIPIGIGFMPDTWTQRMESTQDYEEDASAMGRINSWWMAYNVANDRPLVGGGFELYNATTFAKYAPNPLDVHAAHSIYFQMLGEHGYVGLMLFLSMLAVAWFTGGRVIRAARDSPEKAWAAPLARAIQVSLIGFMIGGAFVNISYWELQYDLMVILMAAYRLVCAVGPRTMRSAPERPRNLAATGLPR